MNDHKHKFEPYPNDNPHDTATRAVCIECGEIVEESAIAEEGTIHDPGTARRDHAQSIEEDQQMIAFDKAEKAKIRRQQAKMNEMNKKIQRMRLRNFRNLS